MNIAGLIQKRSLLVGITAVLLCLPFQAVYADDPDHCGAAGATADAQAEAYIAELPTPYTLEQPFGGRASVVTVGEYIQLVYSYAAGIIGIIAVVLIMAGGLMWIAAAGNEQTIGTAKEIIVSALTAVIIIVLSFAILRIINPTLVTQKFVVPEIPIKGCATPDGTVVSIPTHTNLTGSGSLCPGAAAALLQIADQMKLTCPTCKIGIGSTFRSSDSQEPLYACYQAAVEAGYFAADGKTKTKAGCPADSGCSGCNLAAKPCCSNHRQGTAIDAWFEMPGGAAAGFAETSEGKLSQEYNNGGNPRDDPLYYNQYQLKTFMEATVDGKQLFKGISSEWWHFDYKGDCNAFAADATTKSGCIQSTTTGYSANYYCNAPYDFLYAPATCNGDTGGCSSSLRTTPWYIKGTCSDAGKSFVFDPATKKSGGYLEYTAAPTCQ